MIKKLRYLCTLLLIAVASAAWGQSQSSLVFTAKCGGVGTADDGASWVVSSDAEESNFDSTKGVHFGTGKLPVSYLELSTSDIEGTITKIVVNASGASGTSALLGVTVGGVDFGSTQSLTSTATEYSFEGSASGEIKVRLSQASATKALYVKSIVVTYNNGAVTELLDPELAFVTTSATITLGDEFVLPELTNKGDGAVTYFSSNQNVATVDDNGIVDVKGAGTTVITAKSALTETYKAGSADFTLTVNNAPIVIVDGTYDFTGTEAYGSGLTPSTDNGYIGNATTWTAGNVTLVAEGKYRWWYNANGNTLRFYVPKDETDEYNAGSMTISVPEGKVITKIVITGGKAFEANVGTYENGTWTGSNNSVVLTCTSNSYVETVTVTYGDGDEPPVVVVPVPTFNPEAGEVEAGTTVEIICPDGADGVEYSFDKSNWTEYTTPIEITEATTIYAQAYDEEGNYSEVVSAAYTIKQDVPAYETVTLPYEVDFTKGQEKFKIEDKTLPEGLNYVWSQSSSYGMKASAYVGNTNYASESWLVSPLVDLSENTGEANLAFEHAVNFFSSIDKAKEEATVWVREEGGSWSKLSINYPETLSWSFVQGGTVDLSSYNGKKIQVGFKYVSTTEKAGTWEIKNFNIIAGEVIEKQEAGLSYDVESFTATIGEENEFPVLNNPHNLTGITYRVTNESYATIDATTGEITLVAPGQTTVYAKFDGNDDYKECEVKYVLVVKEKSVAGTDKYELVTDASTLAAGDIIIIVDNDKLKAISTTQNPNNRAATDVKEEADGSIIPSNLVAIIELGGEVDAWTFKVTNGETLGYLYAAGATSNNYLRTQAEVNVKAQSNIAIDEEGLATVLFNIDGTSDKEPKNKLRYNNVNGGIFACYGTSSETGDPVRIYRKVTSTETHSGNVNGDPDGKVDIADVTALVNIIVNNSKPTAEQLAAGDFDNNGTLTVDDVEALVQKILSNSNQ